MSQTRIIMNTIDDEAFSFERSLAAQGFCATAGSDEVGRGPLAGPVVAASVILPADIDHAPFKDSKALTHKSRVLAYEHLKKSGAAIGIGIVSPRIIDSINILQASLLAMKHSLEDLEAKGYPADYVLVDGKFEIPVSLPQQALIKGETKSRSIAAASIVAKITRDSIMEEMHAKYPLYGFDKHKGYPTKVHRKAIADHGPCPEHRQSFRGVKEFVTQAP